MPTVHAGIDIGTNTALMVVARRGSDGTFDVLHDVHTLPRLGEGLSHTGRVSEEAISRAVASMQTFREVLAPYPNARVRAVATSAVRESINGGEVARLLSDVLGHTIEVIDGSEEARLTFLGSVGSTSIPTLMIDIGGGSTEFAIGVNGTISFSTSLKIGAVKFTERFAATRPITDVARREAAEMVSALLAPYRSELDTAELCIGVAGTPVALAMMDKGLLSYDQASLHGHRIKRQRVEELSSMLCSLSLAELRSIPGLHERRADIVPMGSVILTSALNALSINAVVASTKGLRYGAMMSDM